VSLVVRRQHDRAEPAGVSDAADSARRHQSQVLGLVQFLDDAISANRVASYDRNARDRSGPLIDGSEERPVATRNLKLDLARSPAT
jgi:hypothetical protein